MRCKNTVGELNVMELNTLGEGSGGGQPIINYYDSNKNPKSRTVELVVCLT